MIPVTQENATAPVNEVKRLKPLYRGTQIVWAIVAVVDILLTFRFVLKLLAANEGAGFTQFIYTISIPLAYPFLLVFNLGVVSNSVMEWGTLLAIMVYTLIGAGVVKMLSMSKPISTLEADEKLDEQ